MPQQDTCKLLTLVVPTYNMEKYLPRCLDSVTGPSIPSTLEVIVVNDGSRDRSLDIMETYREKWPGIVRVIDKPNGHYGSCINAALQVARGKYFRPLDADDWMDTTALVELLRRLEDCDTDLFVTLRCEYKSDKDGGGGGRVTRFPMPGVEYNKVYDMADFDIARHAPGDEFNMHSMAYKTEILREVGLRHIEGICYTDFQFCFLPIDRIKDFVVFDLYLYYYFIGRDEQSTSARSIRNNLSHICKVVSFMTRHLDACPPKNPTLLANQTYFIDKALNIYAVSLRWQKGITEETYPAVREVIDAVDRHHIRNRVLDKPYLRIWRTWKTRGVLNLTLRIYQWVHCRKMRRLGL